MENAIWEKFKLGRDNELPLEDFYILKEGMVHADVKALKIKLSWMGYGNIKITSKFGSYFAEQVKGFQADHQLPVNGMIDDLTKEKIEEAFLSVFIPGNKYNKVYELLQILKDIGFSHPYEQSVDKEEKMIRAFQVHYKLSPTGKVDYETLDKLNDILGSPLQSGNRSETIRKLKKDLNDIGYGHLKTTDKFGVSTEMKMKKFQRDYGLPVSGIADEVTLEKLKTALKFKERITYTRYERSLDELLKMFRLKSQWNGSYTGETDPEVSLNPNHLVDHEKGRFLFLELFRPNAVSAATLNNFLKGKGILDGQGQAFIDAGKEAGINELFLLSHALSERNGVFRSLGTGIPISKNGNLTYNSRNRNGKIVKVPGITNKTKKVIFNIYGEDFPSSCYVKKAFQEDWNTPEKAIKGGAKFIRENYNMMNNTLYKFVCNPSLADSADAISQKDFDWIQKQMHLLYNLYQQLDSYTLFMEIPVFKGQTTKKYIRG